jgi:signal transduction histidine kinase/CheY-like chemotaxis protein
MELAAGKEYSDTEVEYLKSAAYNIGMGIHSARDHQRLQELLRETQDQAEELQSQHAELESINAELETQTEKLQASEEELRVQQEELQQANQELEERSKLLEERNHLILERNLDIQQKAEELAQSTRYKSEFLANMSHELRTPLNSILLLSRLLAENHPQNLTGDQIEYASVIQSSGKGLLTLIDEILDLSKIESGKMELEWQDVRIENVTEALSAIFSPLAKEKGIEFSVETAADVPHTIESDHLRLEQVLRNLLSNALKFTGQGSVHLAVSTDNKNIFFKVTDTGIGIPFDKQQTIFEAFKQADGSTRRQFGGTGLGLSISRQLARLLGGEIELSSEPEKGSEFTLVLPIEKAHTKPLIEESRKPGVIEQPKITEQLSHQNGNRQFISEVIPPDVPDDRLAIREGDRVILIIDDDTVFARSLLEYTRQQGYKGIVAVRGDDGIQLAGEFLPSGILLDLQLPVKSGWEVMDELKRNPHTRHIPVHIMSSHQARSRSLSQGAIDFISKPLAAEKLSDVFIKIENALNNHPKKVLIVEENPLHAKALAHFLESYNIAAEIRTSVEEGVEALRMGDLNCVILDMGVPALRSGETLERFKKTPGLEGIPVIIFTGKNLSHAEEMNIRKYSDSIVVKTAHSYQRVLDEVSLFLHLVEENHHDNKLNRYKKNGDMGDVLKGKTILVADDDVRNIFSLTKLLENYGVKVVSAVDGKEAVKVLEESSKVDLVLMDMMMPEMDGYDSTRIIRDNPRFTKLPVIAVTAKAMTGDREKCISAGASDYITKPVDIDQLVSLLRVWLYNA